MTKDFPEAKRHRAIINMGGSISAPELMVSGSIFSAKWSVGSKTCDTVDTYRIID